jgi:hypothetical protein
VSLSIWVALAVLVLAPTCGAVFVFLRVRALLRSFKSLGSALDGATRDLTAGLDRMTRNSERLAGASPRLEQPLDRLRVSLAQLSVLKAAIDDARDSLKRLTAVFPAK